MIPQLSIRDGPCYVTAIENPHVLSEVDTGLTLKMNILIEPRHAGVDMGSVASGKVLLKVQGFSDPLTGSHRRSGEQAPVDRASEEVIRSGTCEDRFVGITGAVIGKVQVRNKTSE
jgi:hypothetical protein